MKLVLAIFQNIDDAAVINHLVGHGYRVTRVASSGGFLKKGNITLMIGVDESQLDALLGEIKSICPPYKEGAHTATLFILDATHFAQF